MSDRENLIAHWLGAACSELGDGECTHIAKRILESRIMTEANRRELALAIAPELAAELPGIPY
jgi:hypothetical protein